MDKAWDDTLKTARRLALTAMSRSGPWALVFALAIVLLHAGSLAQEVWNWDESTFLLMGQDILRGHLPYLSAYDNKPPGIFYILAGSIGLFGNGVLAARLAAWAMLFGCALVTFALARRLSGPVAAGLATLVMLAASVQPFAMHANTEIPAIGLVLTGLWLMLARGQYAWSAALAGLCLCLATLFRTNMAYVVVVMGVIYLLPLRWPAMGLHRLSAPLYALGGLLPLGLLFALYARAGAADILWLSLFSVPLAYADGQHGMLLAALGVPIHIISAIGRDWVGFGGLTLLALLGAMRLAARRDLADSRAWRDFSIIAVVGLAVLVSIVRTGSSYDHYILQLYPFAAIGAAIALRPGYFARTRIGLMPLALLICVGAAVSASGGFANVVLNSHAIEEAYPLRQAAQAIARDKAPGDAVWAVENHLVSVYLDLPPIVRVAAHPENIVRPEIARPLISAGFMPADQFGEIIASRPRYVVTKVPASAHYLSPGDAARFGDMLAGYDLWFEQPDVQVYRRR